MKTVDRLASRQKHWHRLAELCSQFERLRVKRLPAASVVEFAALYRATCADLALADAYQLPSGTVHYLHQLVGRAHNQLYRGKKFRLATWRRLMFRDVPRRLFEDRTVWLAMAIFRGMFFLSLGLAARSPQFVEATLGDSVRGLERMYSHDLGGRSGDEDFVMAAFYIQHNTSIGLQCFAYGLLLGVGGLIITAFNAMYLGAVFGHMLTTPQAGNFMMFVTAHGPCELTAIVLCAAAGMRLGFSLIHTGGLSRAASLRAAADQALPTVGAAIVLFFIAALIEGFLSPSAIDYGWKLAVAITSSLLMLFYIVGLGWMGGRSDAAR